MKLDWFSFSFLSALSFALALLLSDKPIIYLYFSGTHRFNMCLADIQANLIGISYAVYGQYIENLWP